MGKLVSKFNNGQRVVLSTRRKRNFIMHPYPLEREEIRLFFRELEQTNIISPPTYSINCQLKSVRTCIKRWSRWNFRDFNVQIKQLQEDETKLTDQGNRLNRIEWGILKRFWARLHNTIKDKDKYLAAKSMLHLLKYGDSNSKFFHESITDRKRNKCIPFHQRLELECDYKVSGMHSFNILR